MSLSPWFFALFGVCCRFNTSVCCCHLFLYSPCNITIGSPSFSSKTKRGQKTPLVLFLLSFRLGSIVLLPPRFETNLTLLPLFCFPRLNAKTDVNGFVLMHPNFDYCSKGETCFSLFRINTQSLPYPTNKTQRVSGSLTWDLLAIRQQFPLLVVDSNYFG